MNFTKADLQRNIQYKTSRSGGAGGQNVNKVSTKVELLFSISDSDVFTDEEKALLLGKLQSRLNKDGLLQIVCDEERSQYLNKEIALDKLADILTRALHQPKKRKKSKPSKAAIAARLDNKRKASLKKMNRRKTSFE
ncbi:peptide chain release factor 1 [Mucilaginibacter sp. PPCGB 2223]|uniref:alternative ribosome rescue aminoacyl-tRNA hydrolase ArfB n=1 Tax=Mucilaginibacter sp. PPCGB 2223 TaxID=1886027 RepID=UPI0008248042|nr:alternative ribosome rescue aminoacyl-tRNA hydrolase ArfB [Mucilaginibacter sp. PPCGB 2223]OCX51363.1 peptide chain release factor 1 [Mucilaginibacter sp. PPCGB 2223]